MWISPSRSDLEESRINQSALTRFQAILLRGQGTGMLMDSA